jgi:hypothetical protein
MADSPEEMILALLGFAAFALILLLIQVARSNSGNGDASGDIVHIDDLRDVAVLSQLEEFDVGFWRQSSEIYKLGRACTSRGQALKDLQSTFRRAKIDFVRIKRNNIDELDVWRASHGARGVREGKKLGGATIKKVIESSEDGKKLDEFISTSPNINVNAETLDSEIDVLFEPIKELSERHEQAMHYVNCQSQRMKVCREVIKNYGELFEVLGKDTDVDDNLADKLTKFVNGNDFLSKEIRYEEEVVDLVWQWFSEIKSQNPDFNPMEEGA